MDNPQKCTFGGAECETGHCVRNPALRVHMMPRDTNPDGTIFGGVILSEIDVAGVIQARHHGLHKYVTVAMDKVIFKAPVYVGDIVSLFTETVKVGNTSLTVQVDVCAERRGGRSCVHVTSAQVTYVAVDDAGKPIPVNTPHTLPPPPP